MNTITVEETLVKMCCWNCGITYAMPERFQRERLENGGSFYCPSGHSAAYMDSAVKKLQRKLNQEIASHDRTRTSLTSHREWVKDAERRVSAHRGVATKLRKRAANGVCPCCTRTFVNLKRHMAAKHPGYADASTT